MGGWPATLAMGIDCDFHTWYGLGGVVLGALVSIFGNKAVKMSIEMVNDSFGRNEKVST